MIVAEFKKTGSTVRVHDEFCEIEVNSCISHLGRIISESYKRRQLLNQPEESEIAAANIPVNAIKS